MSDTANENVVSLDDYGQMRRGLGNGPGTQALREIRDLASNRLKQHVERMMEKVDDALFARAEKAENNVAQTTYFDAMREMRIIREDIEEDFITGFNARFNQGVPRQAGSSQSLSLNFEDNPSIGLVGKDDMEEELAIANMVTKTRGTCTQSLYSLDKRIGFLIRDPDLEHWQNPLGPESICGAFREAAKRIETGLEIRLVIFKLFDQHVICHMDELYKEINQTLVKLGVLPEIRATVRKSGHHAPHPYGPAGHPGAGGDPTAPGYVYETGEYPGGAAGGYSGVPGNGAGGYAAGPGMAGGYAGGHPGGGYAGGGYPGGGYGGACGGVGASLAALTFLQQGGTAAGHDPRAEFGIDPSAMASGQVNILHGMKGAPVIRELGKAGDMTIDIVAMLFDYILDEPSIPDAMRALIGRLQIPVLKVALMEREFFTRKSHPARQLLNRLASSAVSWNEKQGTDDPLYRKIESIVQTILDKFEDDTRLFETLLNDLDAFLKQEEQRAELRAERSVKVMEGHERLEVAKATTLEEIEPRVNDDVSLEFIREFVTGHWKNLLFITCARQGKDSEAWKQAVATMDDLIWSVKPKHTLEDRKRLVAIQPGLLTSLRAGMERLSIPSTERDEFIARLVRAHGRTAVNREDDDDDQEQSANAANDESAKTAIAVRETTAGETADQVNAEATQTDVEPEPVDDECSRKVQRLATGTWLEILDADGVATRAKLSWISPITGTYLFTDRQGLKAGNYTRNELANLLRRARARILNDSPLMDRVVGEVLKQYRKQ
jgi:Protein of unknown function (DUF1631)